MSYVFNVYVVVISFGVYCIFFLHALFTLWIVSCGVLSEIMHERDHASYNNTFAIKKSKDCNRTIPFLGYRCGVAHL